MWSMNVQGGVPLTTAMPIVRSFEQTPFPVFPYNGDIVLAFTGVSANSSIGAVGVSTSPSLTGIQNTASIGTLTANNSLSITGNAGTGAIGTLTPSTSKALTGNSSSVSVGTITVGVSQGLTGNQSTASLGTITHSRSIALQGIQATTGFGSFGSGAIVLSGVSATASVGNLIFQLFSTTGSPERIVTVSEGTRIATGDSTGRSTTTNGNRITIINGEDRTTEA